MTIKTEMLESFPPGNPFHHDTVRMGTDIGTNVTIMHTNFSKDYCDNIIIVNTKTGERLKVSFTDA